jgi:hypothetical protein
MPCRRPVATAWSSRRRIPPTNPYHRLRGTIPQSATVRVCCSGYQFLVNKTRTTRPCFGRRCTPTIQSYDRPCSKPKMTCHPITIFSQQHSLPNGARTTTSQWPMQYSHNHNQAITLSRLDILPKRMERLGACLAHWPCCTPNGSWGSVSRWSHNGQLLLLLLQPSPARQPPSGELPPRPLAIVVPHCPMAVVRLYGHVNASCCHHHRLKLHLRLRPTSLLLHPRRSHHDDF